MTTIINRRNVLIGGAAMMVARPAFAQGALHEVQMLNMHPEDRRRRMVFFPLIQAMQPGDTVKFLSVNPGHNSESIEGMVPDGAEAWKGRVNEEIELSLTVPGFYGYKCLPHFATGMVGLIVVEGEGKLNNLEAARAVRHRGRAAQIFDEIWAEAEAAGLLEESTA